MAKIELSQLIAEMTPEQKILCQGFYSMFDNRNAANRRIINIEPVFFSGVIAGHEILTYAATKLYICLKASFFTVNATSGASPMTINYQDEANVRIGILSMAFPYWDATAAALRYVNLAQIENENFYFSRFELVSGVTSFRMIGYRVTLG